MGSNTEKKPLTNLQNLYKKCSKEGKSNIFRYCIVGRAITICRARVKSPILLSQYWKREQLFRIWGAPIIFLLNHFLYAFLLISLSRVYDYRERETEREWEIQREREREREGERYRERERVRERKMWLNKLVQNSTNKRFSFGTNFVKENVHYMCIIFAPKQCKCSIEFDALELVLLNKLVPNSTNRKFSFGTNPSSMKNPALHTIIAISTFLSP